MYRIMVVDDEKIIVDSISAYLQEYFEIEIHRAYSALEAIEELRARRFDIVITDVSMPVMSGVELLGIIKQYWPACRVIILTAHQEFNYAYNTLKYDNVDYILKVEGYEVIRANVEKYLLQIEAEQNKEKIYINLGKRISLMTPYLRSDLLKRLLMENEGIPEQSLLDTLGLPLRCDGEVLLAVGLPEGQGALDEDVSRIPDYVESKFIAKGINTILHTEGQYMVWLIQPGGRLSEALYRDTAVYVHEVLDGLPEILMKQSDRVFSMVAGEGFIPISGLPSLYRKAVESIERFRGESGVKLILSVPEAGTTSARRSYPSVEDFNRLWELLKSGNRETFFQIFNKNMSFIRKFEDLQKVLPLKAVSAAEMLILEGAAFFEADEEIYLRDLRRIYAINSISGSKWLDEAQRLFSNLIFFRQEVRQKDISNIIKKINLHIEENFASDLSLSSIADMVHYNPSYLSRLYKEQTGKSLSGYINEVRIDKAKQLLVKTDGRVSDIAVSSGFFSTKYFNQAFKKATGLTANEYRTNACIP